MIDGNIAHKIVDAARLRREDPAVEVGPGAGALTAILARREVRLVAVELDRNLADALGGLLSSFRHVTVLQQDALGMDWRGLQRRHFGAAGSAVLISNLPYNISTPFLHSLYKQNFPFQRAILMLQKEVALRLTAEPGGDYGALSVFSRFYTEPQILFFVSRSAFWPRPEVDSAVVALQPRTLPLSCGEEAVFRRAVEAAFQQRRKMVSNSLRSLAGGSRDQLISFLRGAEIDPRARAETLTVEQFAKLARIAYNYTNKCT
ncbi:MAG: ribosomal RNA small subunit methyltransferase A [Firmicutes bacterium]|nr:ribosomal RNA small subunit methyltransferase A [Bacillota bacterium]